MGFVALPGMLFGCTALPTRHTAITTPRLSPGSTIRCSFVPAYRPQCRRRAYGSRTGADKHLPLRRTEDADVGHLVPYHHSARLRTGSYRILGRARRAFSVRRYLTRF